MKLAHWYFAACPLPFPSTHWRCKIVDNADGDTLTLYIDRGWLDLSMMEIRLADIDAVELRSGPAAERAKGRAAWEMIRREAVGRWAMLATRMDPEKYGRILGTIAYQGDDGTLHEVSAVLRAAGFEKP